MPAMWLKCCRFQQGCCSTRARHFLGTSYEVHDAFTDNPERLKPRTQGVGVPRHARHGTIGKGPWAAASWSIIRPVRSAVDENLGPGLPFVTEQRGTGCVLAARAAAHSERTRD